MSDSNIANRQRRGRRGKAAAPSHAAAPVLAPVGGRLRLLDEGALQRIHETALALLARTGISEAPPAVIDLATAAGATLGDDGRLCFPESLVEAALAGLRREITLHGRGDAGNLVLGGDTVHVGTGGASPEILDLDSGQYRPSTLEDIHLAARLVDGLEHIHFFSRPMVARDIESPLKMEVNTAWACLAGTGKHVMVSASSLQAVDEIAELVYMLAGSEAAFRAAPFLSLNVNHIVPPLRFDGDSAAVLLRAVERGIPVMVNTFGQLGASSPVTIAGCVAQTTAETLAGMVLAWLADPQARAIFGPRPMVTDLRTGAMSGGGGEQAKLTAAAIQMARFYNLPSSTIAGATDSKWPDAQAGHEKCLAVTLAVQAGAHFITQAAGTQASLMGTSLESYVIDNDMLGAILSAHTAIEVSDDTLDAAAIHDAATGAGHFLGEASTLARMTSDFLYPAIGDRRSIGEWQDDGRPDSWQRAHDRVKERLAATPRQLVDPGLAAQIESRFAVRPLTQALPQDLTNDEVSDVG
ncbi:MAG: trimethylamine methyltransferase [SAR116 cluster bacterium]|nr:MAG: trimethylamine methyltransferase [SAR116 cluster bacterium]|tara:strand:- start:3293 stop:4867 length:1575 start_codon:yes stop_codon:yes gene_type:complete